MSARLKAARVGTVTLLLAADTGAAADPDRAQILRALGPERRLREFVNFCTEREEAAALVLFVTNIVHDADETQELEEGLSCPEEVPGIALTATYHLALVIGGHLINELVIPSPRVAATWAAHDVQGESNSCTGVTSLGIPRQACARRWAPIGVRSHHDSRN